MKSLQRKITLQSEEQLGWVNAMDVVYMPWSVNVQPFPYDANGQININYQRTSGNQNTSFFMEFVNSAGEEYKATPSFAINSSSVQYKEGLKPITMSQAWKYIFEGKITGYYGPSFYGDSRQWFNISNGTMYGTGQISYMGVLITAPTTGSWEMAKVQKTIGTPADWQLEIAIDVQGVPPRPDGQFDFYVVAGQIVLPLGSKLYMEFEENNGIWQIIRTYEMISGESTRIFNKSTSQIYGRAYRIQLKEVRLDGSIGYPFKSVNIAPYMGGALMASALMSGTQGVTFPLDSVVGATHSIHMYFPGIMKRSDNIDSNIPVPPGGRIKFRFIPIKSNFDKLPMMTEFAVSIELSSLFNQIPIVAAEPVRDVPILMYQGGLNKTTEWFPYQEDLILQDAKIHIGEFGQGGYRLSDWFTTNEMFFDWRIVNRQALQNPNTWQRSATLYSPKQTKRAIDAGFIELRFYHEAYYEFAPNPDPPTPPTPPDPPTPIPTTTQSAELGAIQLIQEKAIQEGEYIIQNEERMLTSQQFSDVAKMNETFEYQEFYLPDDVELVNRAKKDLHNFLRSGPAQNTYKDASLPVFFAEFQKKQNPKQFSKYPHLSDERAQSLLKKYYPDSKTLMDVFDHPSGKNRPYFDSLREEQLTYVPGKKGIMDSFWNWAGDWTGFSTRAQKAQYEIASDPTAETWSNKTKAYYKYGTPYEPFNKTQSLMFQSIYMPLDSQQKVYDPEVDDINTDTGESYARLALDYLTSWYTDPRKKTILATSTAMRTMRPQQTYGMENTMVSMQDLNQAMKTSGARIGEEILRIAAGSAAIDVLYSQGMTLIEDIVNNKRLQAWLYTEPEYPRFVTTKPSRYYFQPVRYNNQPPVLMQTTSLVPDYYQINEESPLAPSARKLLETHKDNPVVKRILELKAQPMLQKSERQELTGYLDRLFYVTATSKAEVMNLQIQEQAYSDIAPIDINVYDNPIAYSYDPLGIIDELTDSIIGTMDFGAYMYNEGLGKITEGVDYANREVFRAAQEAIQLGDKYVVDPLFDKVLTPLTFGILQGLWELAKYGSMELAYASGRVLKQAGQSAVSGVTGIGRYLLNAALATTANYIQTYGQNDVNLQLIIQEMANSTKSIVQKAQINVTDPNVRKAAQNVSSDIQNAFNANATNATMPNNYTNSNQTNEPAIVFNNVLNQTIRNLTEEQRQMVRQGHQYPLQSLIPKLQRLHGQISDTINSQLNSINNSTVARFNPNNVFRAIVGSMGAGITTDLIVEGYNTIQKKIQPVDKTKKRKVVLYKPKNLITFTDAPQTVVQQDIKESRNNTRNATSPQNSPNPIYTYINNNPLNVYRPKLNETQIEKVTFPIEEQSTYQKLKSMAQDNPFTSAAILTATSFFTYKAVTAVGLVSASVQDAVAITNSDLTETTDGALRNLHSMRTTMQTAIDNVHLNRDMEINIRKGMGIEMKRFSERQRLRGNMHGYFHFKVLKSIVDPETVDELELQKVLKRYFSTKSISNSSWKDDIENNEDSQFLFLTKVLDKAPILHNFIERITHEYSGKFRDSKLGGMYISERSRAPYELPEYKSVRPLQQPFIKKRDQKRK